MRSLGAGAETPWGQWIVVHLAPEHTIKVLTVNPGAMLSLQSHDLRSELWQPLSDGLVAYLHDQHRMEPEVHLMKAGKVYKVGQSVIHRLINPTAKAIDVVEVISGQYDEEDIHRYHDAYGRE